MGEESSQGITRRDLLRRGAVLGGAVVWTTPVVQTLGMGRAFAQTPSRIDVSYIGLWWRTNCAPDGLWLHAKNEEDGSSDGKWDAGALPGCTVPSEVSNPESVDGSTYFNVSWSSNGCVTVTSGPDCQVLYVAKGGSSNCVSGTLAYGQEICLDLN